MNELRFMTLSLSTIARELGNAISVIELRLLEFTSTFELKSYLTYNVIICIVISFSAYSPYKL